MTRVIHAEVTLTGLDFEPTGLVEVSIEALRMLVSAAGFDLVEHVASQVSDSPKPDVNGADR